MGFHEDAAKSLEVFEERAVNREVDAIARAFQNLARGDEEQALYWLARIAEEKEPYRGVLPIIALKQNTFRDPVLDQPEFIEVRERLGFTDL